MKPLGEVIAALRRELEADSPTPGPLASEPDWAVEQVTVRLPAVAREVQESDGASGLRWLVAKDAAVSAADGGFPAQLEITLRRRGSMLAPPGAGNCSRPAASSEDPMATNGIEERKAALTAVFGNPGGFYSHNRAEVFLAALAELDDAAVSDLRAALRVGKAEGLSGDAALSFGQIANILRSGPAGSVERGGALLDAALDGISRAELKRFIESTWTNAGLSST